MPILTEQVITVPRAAKAHVADWIYDHTWVGYQTTTQGMIFYRLPTMRECWQYYTAYNWDPARSCERFLNMIILWGMESIESMTMAEVGELVRVILNEHYPRSDKIFDVVDGQQQLFQTDLLHAMETHCRMVGETRRVWDMNLQELVELVGMAQAITGQSLRGNDGKSNQHQQRHRGRRPGRSGAQGQREHPTDRGVPEEGRQS